MVKIQVLPSSTLALYTLCNKLLNPEINNVIICHSQDNYNFKCFKNLYRLGLDKQLIWTKIEIYAFANCSIWII